MMKESQIYQKLLNNLQRSLSLKLLTLEMTNTGEKKNRNKEKRIGKIIKLANSTLEIRTTGNKQKPNNKEQEKLTNACMKKKKKKPS